MPVIRTQDLHRKIASFSGMREYKSFLKMLGRRIQEERKFHGLTQKELAEKLGITRVYMGYIEQGRESPSMRLMYKISERLERVFTVWI